MSAVVYARVPDSLKHALHAHGSERALTLTAAVVDLLGQSPQCRKPVRAYDLLVSGHCPNSNCRRALTSLLTPAPRAGLDSNEYLALLGALGVLVGLAHATTAEPNG